MIRDILIGVLGNFAYDILKRVVKKSFNNEDSETVKVFLKAFDRATNRLFDQYGDTIGKPESSFLSKESNWALICTCIYYGSVKLAPESIDISGLGIEKQIVIPAVRDFIKILQEEMHKESQLDKILVEKEHIRETSEIKLLLEQVLETLSQREQDEVVAPTIERMQREFFDSISPYLIGNQLIHREETNVCLSDIKENKFVLVHGAAGYGKSGVLYELTKLVIDEGIIFLPIRLDRRTPEKNPKQFGIDIGFSKSPVSCLVSYAGSRRCVLILDQLDAIRWTNKHSSNALDICKELIREAQLYQQSGISISVVLSCRTFDLENDPEINNWLKHKGTWDFSKISIGLLSEPCVREIVGEPFNNMTERQRSILTNPQNLSVWVTLNEQGSPPLFHSAIELIREFWKNRRSQLEDLGITTNDINSVLNCLVNWLESNSQISAPSRVLSECSQKTIKAFYSFGIFTEQNSKITFCHQSYLDFLIAERLVKEIQEGGNIITWLGPKEKQTLFRREQLRQALSILAEESLTKLVSIINQIITDQQVRFHLKHLVMEFIGQIDGNIDIIAEYLMTVYNDDYWKPHILDIVFYGHAPYVLYLIQKGIITVWLESDSNEIDRALWLLRSIAEKSPNEVTGQLRPYINKDKQWNQRIAYTLSINLIYDSEDMFDLRLQLVGNGLFPDIVDWKSLSEKCPIRALKLVEAYFTTLTFEKVRNGNPSSGTNQFKALDDEDLTSLYRTAELLPFETLTLLLPHVERLTMDDEIENAYLRKWQVDWQDLDSTGMERGVTELLIKAGQILVKENPEQFLLIFEPIKSIKSRVIQKILIEVLPYLPKEQSDWGIQWLLEDLSHLELGEGHSHKKWEPARRLIENLSPFCSEVIFSRLEQTIVKYHNTRDIGQVKFYLKLRRDGERVHYWGEGQYFLLPALSSTRITKETKSLIQVLERTFKGYFDDRNVVGGSIGSKLDKNLFHISDRAWLEIVKNREIPRMHGNRLIQVDDENVVESSVWQFSSSLERIAKQYPERFGKLALKFPDGTDSHYISAIFNALALVNPDESIPSNINWQPASLYIINSVLEKFYSIDKRDTAMSFCRLVRSRSSERIPDRIIEKLLYLAMKHPDLAPGKLTVECDKSVEEVGIDTLYQNTINCVRGTAAETIGQILWNHQELFELLKPGIESSVTDPHPVVRMAAVTALLPILKINKPLAVKWFIQASKEDLRIPASPYGIRFLKYSIRDYMVQLTPVIQDMINSERIDVSTVGAQIVAAQNIYIGEFCDEFNFCLHGTAPLREGVAKVAAEILINPKYKKRCHVILLELMNDPEEKVRKAVSGIFNRKGFDLGDNIPLAIIFTNSEAFKENYYGLIRCLKDYKESLVDFSDIILDICKALATTHADETRSFRSRMGFIAGDISVLLLRLYEQVQNDGSGLSDRCLDSWDIMFENRVGRTRELTTQIDR